MRAAKKYFIGSSFAILTISAAAYMCPGLASAGEMMEELGKDVGSEIAWGEAQKECLGNQARSAEARRAEHKKAFDCLSNWTPTKNILAVERRLEAQIPELGVVGKKNALRAFQDFRVEKNPAGGLLLMSLLSQSQSQHPDGSALAAKEARELMPKIKDALLSRSMREEGLAKISAGLNDQGAGLDSAATKVFAAYWMTQNFTQVSAALASDPGKRLANFFEVKKTSLSWAEDEWAKMKAEDKKKRFSSRT